MVDLSQFNDAPVAVFGLGRTGLTTSQSLMKSGADVWAWDDNSDARDQARATGHLVAASDGKVYTGASDEDTDEHKRRVTQTLRLRDAVEHIAAMNIRPAGWEDEAPSHLIRDFALVDIESAINWLHELYCPRKLLIMIGWSNTQVRYIVWVPWGGMRMSRPLG